MTATLTIYRIPGGYRYDRVNYGRLGDAVHAVCDEIYGGDRADRDDRWLHGVLSHGRPAHIGGTKVEVV